MDKAEIKWQNKIIIGVWNGGMMADHSHRFIELLPADLLEDVVAADVLDVLIDDGPGTLFFSQLPLQPAHYLFIVVPQIGLRNRGREMNELFGATKSRDYWYENVS